ncbi:MAG: hypothetical protein KAT53_01505, partial [Dehalococcoidia bacterium]|nr:hypothetical protein [Dehalococcoidia bacterium]
MSRVIMRIQRLKIGGSPLLVLLLRVFLCALLLLLATSSVVYAKTFVGPSTITISDNLTDWGTPGSPTSGVYLFQDASNTGEQDGTGFAGTDADINYFWTALSTEAGGDAVASPSNLIEYSYYRIDTHDTQLITNLGQSYYMQLNLGTADPGYADHLLQVWVRGNDTPDVTLVLYEYDVLDYPAMRAFTEGDITGKVSNVADPYPGFTGVQDTNASGAQGLYDDGGTNKLGIQFRVPIDWYSSTYGGAVRADGPGAEAIISATFTGTGTLGAVGTVKDTLNDASEVTRSGSTNALTGETGFITEQLSKIVFTTSAQTITAGVASGIMTIQTQDGFGAPVNVSANTTINLTSTSANGTFDIDPGGAFDGSITTVTILSGSNSASFYYKDTTAGTPTIEAAEWPDEGWTDATQQETVTPAALHHFTFDTIGDQTAGTPFSITITAEDEFDNTVTSYNGTNTLSDTTGTISPDTTTTFVDGVWTGTVTIPRAQSDNSIDTTGDSKPGTSLPFNVAAYPPSLTTDNVTSIEGTTATLNGTLTDDGGEACEVRFQYGETIGYGTDTPW